MNILVTGANGQLGREMRILSEESGYRFFFTDVVEAEGVETTPLDMTDATAVRANDIQCIVNCLAYSVLDKSKIKEIFGIRIPYWTDSLKICMNNLKNN